MYGIVYIIGFAVFTALFARIIAQDDFMDVERDSTDRFMSFLFGSLAAIIWPVVLPLGFLYFAGKNFMFPQVKEYEERISLREDYGKLADDALTMASVFREANMLDEAKRQEDMYRQFRKKESELW